MRGQDAEALRGEKPLLNPGLWLSRFSFSDVGQTTISIELFPILLQTLANQLSLSEDIEQTHKPHLHHFLLSLPDPVTGQRGKSANRFHCRFCQSGQAWHISLETAKYKQTEPEIQLGAGY